MAFLCYTEEKYGKGVEIMFNEYMWQTYLKAGVKEVVDMFETNLVNNYSSNYASEVFKLHKTFCVSKYISRYIKTNLLKLSFHISSNSSNFRYGCYSILGLPDKSYTINEILHLFYEGLKRDKQSNAKQIFDEFTTKMPYYTTFISIMFPELFTPYYFDCNFNVLEKIAQEFDI